MTNDIKKLSEEISQAAEEKEPTLAKVLGTMTNETEVGTPILELKTAYPDLLNALSEMQDSPAYAARKGVLAKAERTIFEIERDLNAAKLSIASSEADAHQWKNQYESEHAKAERYRSIFEHYFVTPEKSDDDPHREACGQCGLNLRDEIHKRGSL